MTRKILENKIRTINSLLGLPLEPYAKNETGRYVPQARCIFVEHNAHYGYKIVQMADEGSGEHTLTEGLTLKAAKEWATGALWMHSNPAG